MAEAVLSAQLAAGRERWEGTAEWAGAGTGLFFFFFLRSERLEYIYILGEREGNRKRFSKHLETVFKTHYPRSKRGRAAGA